MNAQELKKWLASHGCTFGTKKGGSGHIVVRRGDTVTDPPMHGGKKELGKGLVNAIKKPGTQMMFRYRLVFEPDDNGTILVTSPDFPPLVTYGEDEASAKRHAADAMEILVGSMMEAREDIPVPTSPRDDTSPYVGFSLRTALKVELYRKMLDAGLTRADLQRRLGWHRESIDRLFRLDHSSKIEQLDEAFHALGHEVAVRAEAVAA